MMTYFKESVKYLLRSRPFISKYVKEIEGLYNMSLDELKERNEKRFIEIFRKAYSKSPFYHQLYVEAGISINDIQSLEDITKLPIVTKEMVKEHGDELLTCPKWKLIRNHTSGTTGTPLNVWESWESIWRAWASIYCYRKRYGFVYGRDVMVSLRGHLRRNDTVMWLPVSKHLYLSSYNLKAENTLLYHQAIIKRRPKAIEGYPSSLYAFACFLEEKGLNLTIPLCFTSSENLLDYQRRKIERVFHTEVFDLYGMTERTIQLIECRDHHGYYESPGFSINEYLPEGTYTTSLINDSFPLIRYQIHDSFILFDTGVVLKEKGVMPKVQEIAGRDNCAIRGKDGSFFSDVALTMVMKDGNSIKYSQFVQYPDGHVDLNLVPFNGILSEIDRNRVVNMIDKTIGADNIDLSIQVISEDQIIFSRNGKFSFVVRKEY